MNVWAHELRLILRSGLGTLSIILLGVLAVASVAAGLAEVRRQNAVIARIQPQQASDVAAIAAWVDKGKDPGNAAYYTFHPTWNAPSPLAFAAIGMRDVSPFVLRVRALGLEAQLYDGEIFNPELALPGRFDFAFVLVYLVPLFVIALFHDLKSGEREAMRLNTLDALPSNGLSPWQRRRALRFMLLYAAAASKFLVGAVICAVAPLIVLAVLALIAAYMLIWALMAALIERRGASSNANAASLAAVWLVLTLILPTLAHLAINRAIPVGQGIDLTLAQRERVHGAWEIPRETTMAAFFSDHPQWKNTAPLKPGFEWKWYFAFHQLGDESVTNKATEYRKGLLARESWSERVAVVLPGFAVQTLLTRMANADLTGQLAYEDRIRDYHRALREFYYGYLFTGRAFGKAEFVKAPVWTARNR